MGIFPYIATIDGLCIFIISILLINLYKKKGMLSSDYRHFIFMLSFIIIMLSLDILIYLIAGQLFLGSIVLSNILYTIYYVLVPIPCLLLFFFVYKRIFKREKVKKIYTISSLAIIFVNTILCVLNYFFNIFYTINDLNVYSRGPFIWLEYIFSYIFVITAIILIIVNKSKLRKHEGLSFIITIIIPLCVSFLQIIFSGISLMWPMFAVCVFLIFLNIYDELITTDHLTGLNNRRNFMYFLEKEIKNLKSTDTLCGIMFDIDNFKQINDKHGHIMGDECLICVAKILRRSFPKAFITRYGGDEFIVVMDVENELEIKVFIDKYKKVLDDLNLGKALPFKLSVSHGVEMFKKDETLNASKFIKKIDKLMYANKCK